ncbi:hypothetical protein C8Q75DRAFT_461328 [Abortiporus biennis]|nr:hypothetical protein C8Q75DRAFT_461328 [Abortiporus biennis]
MKSISKPQRLLVRSTPGAQDRSLLLDPDGVLVDTSQPDPMDDELLDESDPVSPTDSWSSMIQDDEDQPPPNPEPQDSHIIWSSSVAPSSPTHNTSTTKSTQTTTGSSQPSSAAQTASVVPTVTSPPSLQGSAVNAAVSSSPSMRPNIFVGIAFAAIAGVSLLLILVIWFFKIRTKPHPGSEKWPWEFVGPGALEKGSSDIPSLTTDVKKSDEASETGNPATLDYDQRLPPVVTKDQVVSHSSLPSYSNYMRGNTSSTDGYMSPPRTLRVANGLPDDIMSLADPGIELPIPTAHSPINWDSFEHTGDGIHHAPSLISPEDGKDLPPAPPVTPAPSEGWAASIRSNIWGAFHAVTGHSRPQSPTETDIYTSVPIRTSQNSSSETGSTSRQPDKFHYPGIILLKDVVGDQAKQDDPSQIGPLNLSEWSNVSTWTLNGDGSTPRPPPSVQIKSRDRVPCTGDYSGSKNGSSSDTTSRATTPPPQLPQIPIDATRWDRDNSPLSGLSISRKKFNHNRSNLGSRTLKSRLSMRQGDSLFSMPSHPLARNLSTDSQASEGSVDDALLTDQEKLAKRLIRERRKKLNRIRNRAVGMAREGSRKSFRRSLKRRNSGNPNVQEADEFGVKVIADSDSELQ